MEPIRSKKRPSRHKLGGLTRVPEEKVDQIRKMLSTTQLPASEIARLAGSKVSLVGKIDHAFDVRPPEFSDQLTRAFVRERQRAATMQKKARVYKGMPADLKRKIITENMHLFVNPINYYVRMNHWVLNKYGLQREDIVNDFILHCMKKLDYYDQERKLQQYVNGLFRNFIKNYFREKEQSRRANEEVRTGRQLSFPWAKKELPRGYALIPRNMRDIWIGLGLKLETAIRFGEEETATALSYLTRNSNLAKTEEKVMTHLIEGGVPKQIAEKLEMTEANVSLAKINAIEKIKKFISVQRKNGTYMQ